MDESENAKLWHEALTTTETRQLTEDAFGPSVGPGFVTAGIPRDLWSAISESAAVQWTREPSTLEYRITGMVLFGDIDRDALNAINLRQIRNEGLRRGRNYSSGAPPGPEEVRDMWQDVLAANTDDGSETFQRRADNETADDFYRRVAKTFTTLMQASPGAATKELAARAGVPFHTANYWVRQARQRGYLPRSSRQRPERGEK